MTLVGGYAVAHYGYPRATGDLDVWIASNVENQHKLVEVLSNFGFNVSPSPEPFLREGQLLSFGQSPLRIDILTRISGVEFEDCYRTRSVESIQGVEISIIRIDDLKKNKRSTGKLKDEVDIRNLPD